MDGGSAVDHDGVPQEAKAGRRPARIVRWVLVVTALVLVMPPIMVASLLAAYSLGTPIEGARSGGHDAAWLGHAWVDGRHDDGDVRALAEELRGGGVRDLFVHTGPLGDDGRLDPALHPRAQWAIESLREAVPGVRVQAWLGQRVDPGRLDLDDPGTRMHIADSVRTALSLGFDGVHFNFEPVPNGQQGLLALLDSTHELTRSRGATLSMSAHQVEPGPWLGRLENIVTGHEKWWSPSYLSQVARRVDQIAIMSYDTAMPAEALYSGYVRRQTRLALTAVPPETGLLIGVPAYHERTLTHHPGAETTAAAIRGVRLAVGDVQHREFGVAIYADFSAKETDWRDYRAEWMRD